MAKININDRLNNKERNTFEQILSDVSRNGVNIRNRTEASTNWIREIAKKAKTNPSLLLRERPDRLVNSLKVGEMGFFMYEPKHKETLPYYDSFPLIFKVDNTKGGFYGINLHYLPLLLRAKLMDALWELTNNKKMDETTRLRISYSILNTAARYKAFKPCFKMYLTQHVRSRFIKITSVEWDIALMLPVAQWNKANASTVYSDSRKRAK